MADQRSRPPGTKPPMAPKPRTSLSGMPSMMTDEGLNRLMDRFGEQSMPFGPGAPWKSKFDQMGGMTTNSGSMGTQQTVVTHTRVTSGTGTQETKITRTSSTKTKTMSKFQSFDQSNSNTVISSDGSGSPDSIHSVRSLGSMDMEHANLFSHSPSVKHSFGSLKRRFENMDFENKGKDNVQTQHEKVSQKISGGSTTEVHFSANDVKSEQGRQNIQRKPSPRMSGLAAGTKVNISAEKSSTSPQSNLTKSDSTSSVRSNSPKLSPGQKPVTIPVKVIASSSKVGQNAQNVMPPSDKKTAVKRPEPKPRTSTPPRTTSPHTKTPPPTSNPPRKITPPPRATTPPVAPRTTTPPNQTRQIKIVHVPVDGQEIPYMDTEPQMSTKGQSLIEKYKNIRAGMNVPPPKQVVDIPIHLAKAETGDSDSGSDYEDVMIPPSHRQRLNAQRSLGSQVSVGGKSAGSSEVDSNYSKESVPENGADSESGEDYDEVYVSGGRLRFIGSSESRRRVMQKLNDAENNNCNDGPMEYMDAGPVVVEPESDSDEGYEMVDEFLGKVPPRAAEKGPEKKTGMQGKSTATRRNQNKARYKTDPGFGGVYSQEEAVSDPEAAFYDDVTYSDTDDHYEPVGRPHLIPEGDEDKSHENAVKKIGRRAADHMHALKKKFASRLFNPGKGFEDDFLKSQTIDIVQGQEKQRSLSQPDAFGGSLSAKLDTSGDMDSNIDQKVRSMTDIRSPKFSVFPEGGAPDRPPPRLKNSQPDLNAVVPAPSLSVGPSFPDGYLGDPQLSHSFDNLVSGFPKMDLGTRPPAALPRDAASSSTSTTIKSSVSHTSYSWSSETGATSSSTTSSSNIERESRSSHSSHSQSTSHSSKSATRIQKQDGVTRMQKQEDVTKVQKTDGLTKVEKHDGYLDMTRTESMAAGEDSDSDDFDYMDAVTDEDRIKALEQSMLANKKGAIVDIKGETSSSYLELVDDNVIKRLQRVNRFKSRFGGDEAPLYQIYHKKMCVAAIEDEGAGSDDEDAIYSTFSGPTSPAAIEAPPISTSARCESPPATPDNKALEYTTPTLQTFSRNMKQQGAMRSLWCEMPEVKQSGVLERLSPQQRKLQETLFEIITSEASYQKSLLVLVNNFLLDPIFSGDPKRCIINKRDKHFIFSNVVAVMESSDNLLQDLESRWQKSCLLDDICDIIANHASKNFEVYVRYCSNQMYQTRTLTKLLEENKEFRDAMSSLEKNPACQGLPMKSFLLLPMQRVTRLPLLVDAVCHRCETEKDTVTYPTAKKALEIIQGVVKKCNEGARNMERMEQMVEIERSLKFKVKKTPLISASRYLVKKGMLLRVSTESSSALRRMVKGKASKHNIWLFLFNDLLMLTKKKGDQYVVFDYCSRINISVELVDEPENDPRIPENLPSNVKNLFILALLENHSGKQVEFILSVESMSDRARWIEVLAPAQEENKDEKVYESWDCPQVQAVFQYEAKQPDELSLDESDVVNVVRKMGDGWFEGERIRDGQRGWFPSNHTMEIMNAHVRAKNLKQRYRLMVLSQQACVEARGNNVKMQSTQQKQMI